MSLLGRFAGQQRGAVAVEFALLAPVLVMFLASLADISRLMYAGMNVHNAARDGARAYAVYDPNWQTEASQALPSGTGYTAGSPTSSCGSPPPGTCASGNPVTVTVPLTVTIDMPVMQQILGGSSITISGTATMEIT